MVFNCQGQHETPRTFFPEFANVLILAKEMANVYLDEVA